MQIYSFHAVIGKKTQKSLVKLSSLAWKLTFHFRGVPINWLRAKNKVDRKVGKRGEMTGMCAMMSMN